MARIKPPTPEQVKKHKKMVKAKIESEKGKLKTSRQ